MGTFVVYSLSLSLADGQLGHLEVNKGTRAACYERQASAFCEK